MNVPRSHFNIFTNQSGFDYLPKEILKQITSYLDQSSIISIRTANRLFRTLLLSTNFTIDPMNVDLSDLGERLLKYYNTTLVGLEIAGDEEINSLSLFESISKLSNLSALTKHLRSASEIFYGEYEWLKLTNLTNLYECDYASDAPLSLLSYWSNLTQLYYSQSEKSATLKEILQKLSKLEALTIHDIRDEYIEEYNSMFDWENTPSTLTSLSLYHFESLNGGAFKNIRSYSQVKELSLKTKDESLRNFPFSELQQLRELTLDGQDVDLSTNTKLSALMFAQGNSSLAKLCKLSSAIIEVRSTDCTFFTGLTDLEDLDITTSEDYTIDSQLLSFINSTRLSRLCITAHQQIYYGELSRLTSLQDLTIYEQAQFKSSGKIKFSMLSKIVSLTVLTENIGDYEEVSTLTNLRELQLETLLGLNLEGKTFNLTLSTLSKLHLLQVVNIPILNIESEFRALKNLTNLCFDLNDNSDYTFFEIVPLKYFNNQNVVRSRDFWTSVTKCTTLESLTHHTGSPEEVISSLTALSRLLYLDLSYEGRINSEDLLLLTSLRGLKLDPIGDGQYILEDDLQDRMPWLDSLSYY